MRDGAGLFSADAIRKAKERLAQIDKTYQVSIIVESIESLQGEALDKAVVRLARRAGAEGMFILDRQSEKRRSRRGSARVLVWRMSRSPRRVAGAKSARCTLIAQFRQREFDAGLEKGIDVIEKLMADVKAKGKLVAEPQTPGLVMRNQVRLTLDGARRVIAGAESKAKELNIKVNIAVVDDGGHMIAFERMDGARPASGYTATTKAVTAATFRQATGPLPTGYDHARPAVESQPPERRAPASGGKLTTLYGGGPLLVDGQLIAGVGLGGGTGEQDAAVARAGIASFVAEVEGRAAPATRSQAAEA